MKPLFFILAILFNCTLLYSNKGTLPCSDKGFSTLTHLTENTTFSSQRAPGDHFSNSSNQSPNNLPIPYGENLVRVFAGNDTTICLTSQWVLLNGVAQNYWFVTWITTGDGFFSDANQLNTYYYPGAGDKQTGLIRLILTAYTSPPEFNNYSDTLNLTLVLPPIPDAGSNITICEGENIQLSGTGINFTSLVWTSSGDGYFDDPELPDAFYYPGLEDIASGGVVLCLVANPVSPCVMPAVACKCIVIKHLPYFENFNDTTICRGNSLKLEPAYHNCSAVLWNTSGDGYFSDETTLNPTYFPGEADLVAGSVELRAFLSPQCFCNQTIMESIILTLQPYPTIEIMSDQEVCQGDTVQLTAVAYNYSDFFWLSYGDGTFINPYCLTPEYIPGGIDYERGKIFLELVLYSVEPCNLYLGFYIEVTIIEAPAVNAGEDFSTCGNALLNASAENYESIYWTTTGDGAFSDLNILNPSYIPGIADLTMGFATLTLTAIPVSPCVVVHSDELKITFHEVQPYIIQQSIEHEVLSGDTTQLVFEVESNSSGVYTWFLNDEPVTNSNTPVLTIAGVMPSQAGFYHCTFENICGQLSSERGLLTVMEPYTQNYLLAPGWNGLSSFICPSETNIQEIFLSILDQTVIVINMEGVYWPETNLNTLEIWNNESGYLIKTNDEVSLSIEGMIIYPIFSYKISPGWSLIPVKSLLPVNVQEVFGGFSDVLIIKEAAGTKLYWPAMQINTLQELIPGKAYQLYLTGNETIEIPLPASGNE